MNTTDPIQESPGTPLRDAPRELLALSVAMRPDWDHDETWAALHACHDAGWPFPRTLKRTVALLLRDDSGPRELRDEAAATRPPGETGPAVAVRGIALAREMLAHRETP